MIRPEQVAGLLSISSHASRRERAEIERHFDAAITAAANLHDWPARPRITRSGWSTSGIYAVIAAYRDAGWVIGSGRDCYATFTPPASKTSEVQP